MNWDAAVRKTAKALLAQQAVDGILGLSLDGAGDVSPCVFEAAEALESLVLEPKWLMAKIAIAVMQQARTAYRLAVVCRGCDERALVELGKRNRIDTQRIHIIGVACSQTQAERCLCRRPWPSRIDAGTKAKGIDANENERARPYLTANADIRRELWREAFSRCIKCYGCRNACPVCNCSPCKLEDGLWVDRGEIAPDMLTFHLLRAVHVADACVACGACQDACPVGIPLMLLQLPMRAALHDDYRYEAGTAPERKSPLLSDLIQEPSCGISVPGWTDSLRKDNGT